MATRVACKSVSVSRAAVSDRRKRARNPWGVRIPPPFTPRPLPGGPPTSGRRDLKSAPQFCYIAGICNCLSTCKLALFSTVTPFSPPTYMLPPISSIHRAGVLPSTGDQAEPSCELHSCVSSLSNQLPEPPPLPAVALSARLPGQSARSPAPAPRVPQRTSGPRL